jgi:hypothetical protein
MFPLSGVPGKNDKDLPDFRQSKPYGEFYYPVCAFSDSFSSPTLQVYTVTGAGINQTCCLFT